MHSSHVRRARGRAPQVLIAIVVAVVYGLLPAITHAQDSHVVHQGDTLSAIAEAYGLSVQELVWLNGIDDPDLIIPGEFIALGPTDATSGGAAAPDAAPVSTGDPVGSTSDAAGTLEQSHASSAVDGARDPSADLPAWVDRTTIRGDLMSAADKWGWDPYLIMALAWQESGWRQDEVSYVGAIGVMQIMPETAAELDNWLFKRGLDPWNNVWDNIDAGVAFLTCLYQETGDVEVAIGSYYQGLGSVQRDGFFLDTRAYVDNILYMRDLFAAGELP